ncbi:MAG: hypothetical protein CMB96_06065 [Flavobacteriaceae bacterium]|nr:hypothetical protein [Flavobacteriaceae bacterium]
MSAFTSILSKQFTNIDISQPAFNIAQQLINKDFFSYSFLSSFKHITEPPVNTSDTDPAKCYRTLKFKILKDAVIKNRFICKTKQEFLLSKFCNSQKIYHGLVKAARRFKMKRAAKDLYNVDFHMILFEHIASKHLFHVYDSETSATYTFRLSNIISHIKSALTNSDEFFSQPHVIKNPYTNIPFSEAQLFYIYQCIDESSFIIPSVFHNYFKCFFDINTFAEENEPMLRNIIIRSFLKNASPDQRKEQIIAMLQDYNYYIPDIMIHAAFPREALLEAFDKYLKNYLQAEYSLCPAIKHKSREDLIADISYFGKCNPTFGRLIYHRSVSFMPNTANNNTNNVVPFHFDFNDNSANIRQYQTSYVTQINTTLPPTTPSNQVMDETMPLLYEDNYDDDDDDDDDDDESSESEDSTNNTSTNVNQSLHSGYHASITHVEIESDSEDAERSCDNSNSNDEDANVANDNDRNNSNVSDDDSVVSDKEHTVTSENNIASTEGVSAFSPVVD